MDTPPTPKERYDLARDHLKHEDGLINQRLTWFLIFQGLLFTALMAGFGLFDSSKCFSGGELKFIAMVLALVMILGAASAFTTHQLVRAAYWHVHSVETWWVSQLITPDSARSSSDFFPPLRGDGVKPKNRKSGPVTAAAFLLVLTGVWILLFACSAPILWQNIAA